MSEEIKLLRASLQGDTAAFEQIVLRYQAMVCAITYSATGRVETSEELAQETFLRAWQKLIQLQDLNKFRSWLCSIARNLIRDYLLHKSRQPIQSVDLTQLTADKATPFDHLIKQEEEMILSHALMQIPEEFREPLVLYYRQEQSVKEVAESLDIPEATVRTRMHRGRQMLKDQVSVMVEQTLEKNGPSKKFTKAVMVSIGAGLAAGTAATAGMAAAGAGTTTAATTTGLLTAAGAKVAAIAAAVILAAGAAIYSYNNSQKNQPEQQLIQQKSLTEIQPQTESLATTAVKQEAIKPEPTPQQPPEKPVVIEKKPQPQMEAPKVRHPDWPGINEPIKYVYAETKQTGIDGTEGIQKFWARLQDAFRDEGHFNKITIDNGKQRLVLDPNSKQAQLEPTWYKDGKMIWQFQQSLEEHQAVKMARLSRNPNSNPKYVLTKLAAESNDLTTVYDFKYKEMPNPNGLYAKVWVDNRTLLPEKVEVVVGGEPNQFDNIKSIAMTFDFAPIPDNLFSIDIPSEYNALSAKQPREFSGRVIDLLGNPVAGAEVYLNGWTLGDIGPYKGVSDKNGNFVIVLSPGTQGFIETVSLWAILRDNPNIIAWTLLLNSDDMDRIKRSNLEDIIPGNPGIVCHPEDYLSTGIWCIGASDIVLVMEPAGMISGFVTDTHNLPIPDTKIEVSFRLKDRLENHFWHSNKDWTYTTTDSNGYFEVSPAPMLWEYCEYNFSASAEGYVTDNAKKLKLTKPLENETIHFQLHRQETSVKGVLTDNYDIPLGGRNIIAKVNGKSYSACWARTDPNGCFLIDNCPNTAGLQIFAELWGNEGGYDKQKYGKFNYYPNITVDVECRPEQKVYEVKLVAIRPEIEIEALLVDSAGKPLPYFPVEIRSEEGMPFEWWQESGFEKRADEYGQVVFLNVPQMKGLRLTCYPASERKSDAAQTLQMQEYLKELSKTYAKYHFTEMFVPLELGKKKYQMTVTIPTEEEYKQ